MNFYKVGGCVRDSFLNIKSKDIDYAVEANSFEEMKTYVESICEKVFLVTEQYYTIRALYKGEGVDFVLCRKDGKYSDGRRPDEVFAGTIYDDLARRDFTMNAIAETVDNTYLDPHNGIKDIEDKIIRCVGKAEDRISEDYLRLLRAFRFMITKDFYLEESLESLFFQSDFVNGLNTISIERITEEIKKCLEFDSLKTINSLHYYSLLNNKIFDLFDNHSIYLTLRVINGR